MLSPDQILEALDPEQREVAQALTGPVCVLAGAGTGKTRAITHRIAYGVRTGVYVPTSVLAVTFTARAAGEMRTRLRELGVVGVQARTFHAAALKQLSYFWPKVIGGAPPRIMEHKSQAVAEAARRLGLEVDRVAVRDLATEVEWAKVSMITPEQYEQAALAIDRPAPVGFDHRSVARLLTSYEEVKEMRSVIDFEDVLLLLGGIFQEHPQVAREVRDQYRRFVVDEYQDVSPLQQFVLEQWLGERRELCVVGDPSQTIYSFTGATPYHLLSFAKKHREAQVIRLVRDYRSTPQIVALANGLLVSAPKKASFPVLELVSQRESGKQVTFAQYSDDAAEAASIAARIKRKLAGGTKAGDIAILYRTNAQSEAFENALSDAGVSYLVRGGDRFFARKDVRDTMILLRGAARGADPEVPLSQHVSGVLSSLGWSSTAPSGRGAARERWDALNALLNMAIELEQKFNSTLSDFIADLDDRARNQHAPAVDGVTLASLHAAKGLEWDVVFLAGLSEGLMPISLAETEEAVAEERRLLYVGITRAKLELELSYSQSRNGSARSPRSMSRFLKGIWPNTSAPHTQHGGKSRFLGRDIPMPGDLDEKLYAELVRWRDEQARIAEVTKSSVMPNAILQRVATLRPASIEQLLTVKSVGQDRASRWGEEILELVRGHMEKNFQ
ncbi:ATP-dependent DNA helicase UvrD2 [Populibacterium corticicola]|uniref:DNA 3'-5' helicase n=2 Tax=Populibacterium corticicola TaxID=1812826 RepID=A0ABW5XGK4_9MICO